MVDSCILADCSRYARHLGNSGRDLRYDLEECLAKAEHQPLPPVRKRLFIKGSKDETRVSGHDALGNFYEALFALHFGGRILRNTCKEQYLPDIVDPAKRVFTEVKGSFVHSQTNFRYSQVQAFEQLQAMFPSWYVQVALFTHAFENVKTYDGDDSFLFRQLSAGRTLCAVLMPLEVISRLVRNAKDMPNIVGTYKERLNAPDWVHTYESCIRLKATTRRRLFFEPETMLGLMGFDDNRFTVERYISSSEATINNYAVRALPIVKITPIDYSRNAQVFRSISAAAVFDDELSDKIDAVHSSVFDSLYRKEILHNQLYEKSPCDNIPI